MKKIILLLLCTMIVIMSVGCGSTTDVNVNDGSADSAQSSTAADSPALNEVGSAEELPDDAEVDLPAFEYEFNPHVLSKEYVNAFGTDTEECFYRLCDAVLSGESTFKCSTEAQMRLVTALSRNCLPIADAFIDNDKCYFSDGVAHLAYTIGTDELLTEVSKFKSKVTEVITSAVPYEEDDLILAAELLTAVANKDEYDYEAAEDFEASEDIAQIMKIRPYRAIMEDIGICQELAGEYIYYLLQVGVNATICDGMTTDGIGHAWAVIELDGEHYHVDPTFTLPDKGSLAFFCMDDEQRERCDDIVFDMDNLGYADSNELHYELHDKKYKELWDAKTYSIDRKNRIIHMTTFDGEEKEFHY